MRRLPAILAACTLAAAAGLGLVVDARGQAPTPAPSLPGPSPRGRQAAHDAQKANADCAGCHAEIAAEWRSSMHSQAWVDPVFQSAYAIERVPFCRGCHAPEADAASEPSAAAQAVGVGCTTCHVQAGTAGVVSSRASPSAPHAVFADARMATQQACAACHQFEFPGEKAVMQDTVHEHASSSFRDVACQSCHMPEAPTVGAPGARSHRSHAFAVMKDPAMIRRAARIEATRTSSRSIEVRVGPAGAGHAFPTGDMFRRLEIRAEAIDADGRVIARAAPAFLGRTFADRPRRPGDASFHREEKADTRVPPPGAGGARVVSLDLAAPAGGARIRWSVLYQRMATAMAASFGVDQALDEVLVGEGELPPLTDGGGQR